MFAAIFSKILKFNKYHGDDGKFTSKAKAVHAGHKNKPTVSAMEDALAKVGPDAFEAAVNEHLAKFPNLSPNRMASEIELVARQLIAKADFAKVLKYNPYHGPDGKFATHGTATFVSLRGKQYANILTQPGKNTQAVDTALNKLGNTAHAFGKNYRAGMEGSAQFANNALDQMTLAANAAHTYGNHSQAYGEQRQALREKIANAFAKTGLPAAEKEGLGIPLTASEHAAIAAATLKQKAKEDKKLKTKLEKEMVNKQVEANLAAEAAAASQDWAKHDQIQAEFYAAKEAFLAAGGTQSEAYNLQDKAAKELVKVKDKHAAKFLAIAEEGVMAAKSGDHKTKEKLQKKALKYHKDHMGYMPFSGAQELVQVAKDNVNAKKKLALEAHGKLNDEFYAGRATIEQLDASTLAITKLGATADEKFQAEDDYQAAKAAKKLTGQAPVTAASMADTLAKMGVAMPKDPKQEHAENVQAWLDAKANATKLGTQEAADASIAALKKYKASKDKLMAGGMSESDTLKIIDEVKEGKYKQATGNQVPKKDAKQQAEEKYMAAYKAWSDSNAPGTNTQEWQDFQNAKIELQQNHGHTLGTLSGLKQKVNSGEFTPEAGNQLPEAPKVKMASTMATPLNKDEAMHLAKAMGKQYYDLKAAGAGEADLAKAHALYDQAKDKYVEHGGKKDEFASISSDLKSQATSDYNTIHKAKAQAKQKAYNDVTSAAEAWEDSVAQGDHPDTVAMWKKNMEQTIASAEDEGHMDSTAIATAKQVAKTNATAKVAQIKETHKKAVQASIFKLHSAELAADGNGMNEHALPFANSVQEAKKYLTPEEISAVKEEGKAEAAKQWATIKAFKDAVGNPHATASQYDAKGDAFKYPVGDDKLYKKFKNDQDTQIQQLTSSTRSVLEGYTGSAYTPVNKAVGKYGTAKMTGGNPDPVPSHIKSQAEAMDSAFQQIKLGEDLRLRRNMPQKYFWNQLGFTDDQMHDLSPETLQSMVGKVYKETAYGSTSMNKDFTSFYSEEPNKTGGMQLNIRAHKDINGLRLASISSHSHEEEVVMPRGTTYVIRSVKKVGNFKHGSKFSYVVEVDAIGMFPDKL